MVQAPAPATLTPAQNGKKWATIGIIFGIVAAFGLPAVQWAVGTGTLRADVTNLKETHEKSEQTFEKSQAAIAAKFDKASRRLDDVRSLQVQDGRDLAKVTTAVESIQKDVGDLKGVWKSMIEEMRKDRHMRQQRWLQRKAKP